MCNVQSSWVIQEKSNARMFREICDWYDVIVTCVWRTGIA